MKIAFVCVKNAEDPLVWSGTPFHILTTMRTMGHRVSVISPLKRYFQYLYAPEKLIWNKTLQINREPIALASYARQVRRALRACDAEVVFAPSSIPVSYLECRQPIVFWTDAVYDVMVGYYGGYGVTPRNMKRYHAQERSAMGKASRVIYSSEWGVEAARSNYPEFGAKMSVVPFGANVNPVETFSRRPTPPYKILFMGVDWVRKGGAIAAKVTKLLNDSGTPAILRVVGCDPPEELPYLERYGFLSKATAEGRAAIDTLLRSSDIFFLPTNADASPIVFCESSAYGLPIISTDTGGISTYVRNGVNGFALAPNSPLHRYAEVISEILANPQFYQQLSQGARNEYETRLNWTTGVKTVLDSIAIT